MDAHQFKELINYFFDKTSDLKIRAFLNDASDLLVCYYTSQKIEICFESRNNFDVFKILFLNLQFEENSNKFLIILLRKIKYYFGDSKTPLNEFYFLFLLLSGEKTCRAQDSFALSFELQKKQIDVIKFYFTPSFKGKNFMSLLKAYPLFKKIYAFPKCFLIDRISVGIEISKKNKNIDLKLYNEFLKNNDREVHRFLNILSGPEIESNIRNFCTPFVDSRNKNIEKFGLRIKMKAKKMVSKAYVGFFENTERDILKYLHYPNIKINKSWLCKIHNLVIKFSCWYAYLCYGSDGVEIYIR